MSKLTLLELDSCETFFTDDPLSALQRFVGSPLTPENWHAFRYSLESWLCWMQKADRLPRPVETHYWYLVLEGMNSISVDLQEPKYQHDCDKCSFLGNFRDEPVLQDYDLYACSRGPGLTYLARYGNEGHEYQSGASFVGLIPAITEAARRHRNDFHDHMVAVAEKEWPLQTSR